MTSQIDKYIIEDNGISKVNFELLYSDMTEMSGFLREKRRKDLYDRVNGIVTYALSATDTAIANAGNWEGEVELKNNLGTMVEQTQSFNFTIEESY